MRNWILTLAVIGGGLLASMLPTGQVRAEEPAAAAAEAPKDPTRGQWDSFLDRWRDGEDAINGWQGEFEERTKVRFGAAIDKSYMWNFNDPASGKSSLHSLDPDHNSANLDLAQVSIARPSENWLPGFGVKLDAGHIARRIKSDWDGDGGVQRGDDFETNDFEVEEAYLTYTLADEAGPLKGLTLKGGKFVTLLGAEVIEPWLNYNFSRSFLFGYAIPATNTGVLVSYPIADTLSVTLGGVAGWDNVADNNNSPSVMGNVTWTACSFFTLGVNGLFGPEQNNKISNKRNVIDVIGTIKATDDLTFVLNYDNGGEENVLAGPRRANWQGFAGIANYAFTDRFSGALRGEWFEDSGGARTGTSQGLWETTVDLKYLVTQHLYGRAEYRHDESGSPHVFEAGTAKATRGQDLVGFEFGYVFN
ncbi:MAG: outer membrane beta-barrel protein [Candidatus Binatia bacterium]